MVFRLHGSCFSVEQSAARHKASGLLSCAPVAASIHSSHTCSKHDANMTRSEQPPRSHGRSSRPSALLVRSHGSSHAKSFLMLRVVTK